MRKLVSMSILLIATLQLMSAEEPMAMIQAIELPSVEGRIDHLALDASGERLFVAALGNNTLEVLDLKSGTHVKSVQGFQEPQGVGFAPDFRAIIVANTPFGKNASGNIPSAMSGTSSAAPIMCITIRSSTGWLHRRPIGRFPRCIAMSARAFWRRIGAAMGAPIRSISVSGKTDPDCAALHPGYALSHVILPARW